MGANAEDDGGWGVLVTDMSRDIAQDFIDTGGSLGYTVARLDGDLTGLRRPEQMIKWAKPFSLLPDSVFKPDEDWKIVGQGRWRSADHITLGEARCVVKISRLAAATPALHRTVLPILEDNQPVSGAAFVMSGPRKLDSTSAEKVKPHTLAACRAAAHRLRQFEAALGLDIHWAPHSARAGFASDSVARGIPFQEIKEAGRWLTESSLRIYVDVVTASRVLAQAEQRGIASLVREAAEKLPSYFPKGIFGEDACGKRAADGLAQGGAPDLGELMGGVLAGVTWAAVAVWLIAWMYVSGPMAHFGTMMGVAASVSVSAGKVVDHSLGAVITAARGVSDFAVTSTRHSANILQEAWRGVDITDLRVHQRHAERIADDPSLLQEWVVREFLSVEPRPPGADQVANTLAEASVTLPHATESWQMLVWPGQYRELHMTYDLSSTGFYGVLVVDRIVNFSVQWSNPLWSGLECDLGAERDTILLHINSTLSRHYFKGHDVELEPTEGSRVSLSDGIRGLYQRCLLYDITVVAAGKRFPAHQVALAATSELLRDHVVEAVRLAAAPPAEAGQVSGQPEAQAPGGNAAALSSSAAPREGPPGQPELRLDQIGDPEAARAFLDYVYGMDGAYNITSDVANADVLRLAQQFGLARLEERAAHWLLEALTTENAISRLVALQEFGLIRQYELVSQELISNPLALEQVARKAQLMDHPKILQGLLVQAAQLYREGQAADAAASTRRSRSPKRSSSWSDRRAKASRKLAHVGA
ncbi:unnamed protein product [Prorocentrum cordatum]|uniref:BTB domain-containing protein n=1 Tax=Prorocentrum cordatum TaxID=2364126 RepID=A0ABN9SPX2_9DINO|nr:unnamed protein product [Polarella glacialis]